MHLYRCSECDAGVSTGVTDAGVCIPVVCALAVVRADVGIAGVGHITAFFHVDL